MQVTKSSYRASWLRLLAVLGIFGQVVFILVVTLLPFLQSDYSSFNDPISALLLGAYGFVLSGALFAAGLGSVALAFGIYRTTRGMRGALLGSTLIALWGIGFALAGVVPTDAEGNPTQTALTLHGLAVGLAFYSAPLGILVLSRVFAQKARWSSFYPLSMALGFAAIAELTDITIYSIGLSDLRQAVGPLVRGFEGLGLIQRLFVGTVVVWMLLAAIRLRAVTKDGNPQP